MAKKTLTAFCRRCDIKTDHDGHCTQCHSVYPLGSAFDEPELAWFYSDEFLQYYAKTQMPAGFCMREDPTENGELAGFDPLY